MKQKLEVTDEAIFLNRRTLIKGLGLAAAWPSLGPIELLAKNTSEELTPEALVTSYNNFYEFATDKQNPKKLAEGVSLGPWELEVDGLVERPFKISTDRLVPTFGLEQRVYRFRCVEAWSMVVPWQGGPLARLIERAKPKTQAKYLAFISFYDPQKAPGFQNQQYQWPYQEGLRLDEALHPLTLLATGLYGKPLPTQNGAPLRLVVPWKYGFKSAKSLVKITLTDQQPKTLWNEAAPQEYGFYANVNPQVDHPRWSQAKEKRLGSWFDKIDTLPFNGYAEVASLYKGMDLSRDY